MSMDLAWLWLFAVQIFSVLENFQSTFQQGLHIIVAIFRIGRLSPQKNRVECQFQKIFLKSRYEVASRHYSLTLDRYTWCYNPEDHWQVFTMTQTHIQYEKNCTMPQIYLLFLRFSSESDELPDTMLSSGAETRPKSSLIIESESSIPPLFPQLAPEDFFLSALDLSGCESCGFCDLVTLFSSSHVMSASYSRCDGLPQEENLLLLSWSFLFLSKGDQVILGILGILGISPILGILGILGWRHWSGSQSIPLCLSVSWILLRCRTQ